MTEPTIPIPDEVGYIEGWRAWIIHRGDPSRLRSTTQNCIWPAREAMRAECLVTPAIPHSAPGEGCKCGIWSLKTLDAVCCRFFLPNKTCASGPHVIGRVAVWGGYIPGEKGDRAERAYPLEVFVPDEIIPVGHSHRNLTAVKAVSALADAYGIPVGCYSDLGPEYNWPSSYMGVQGAHHQPSTTTIYLPGR